VGITQYAVEQLTDVTHLQLPAAGKAVSAGQPFGEIESVKAVFDLNAPVSGTVAEKNAAVEKDPSLVNQDPYGKGWMVKIKLAPGAKVDHLLSLQQYEKQIAEGH
jgi:glycine cleavage system H protein